MLFTPEKAGILNGYSFLSGTAAQLSRISFKYGKGKPPSFLYWPLVSS
jgi:hypothetical protein